ncbi:phospholipase C [Chitinophaga costaii]|uniref:phospholipase C n=1 Tax=Chitinophaga costaii TaxID=1335309 RepID=A0A1C4BBT6_9BACT|nr:phospholipase C, phosphocholine-specific [Chitinophaga costaii]PUZ27675.1 phospholipase C, phosphocholine-specific [Chitinophaga costaii]SCC04244.1 phospholipase C [Chitinophaga costaii]
MDTRRDFLKKAALLSGSVGLAGMLPPAIQKALAIDPAPGSTFMDAEHVVLLMQENRSFDHAYGTLRGVRGFNDPRAIRLPNGNPVWLQTDKAGHTYAPFRLNIKDTKATWMHSLPHTWTNQVDARNNGRYDRWLEVKQSGDTAYQNMPLTLGYHTREDLPFYYSLADAFTVCDQHFCSSLTGTTPNRLFFWTGTIRPEPNPEAEAKVWNEDADDNTLVSWPTFPEELEAHHISWKVYQNEINAGVGLGDEAEPWLANFGDNPLEYFTQYHVRLSASHIAFLQRQVTSLQSRLQQATNDPAKATALQKELEQVQAAQKLYTTQAYNALTNTEKNLHEKAFSTNKNDPDFHKVTTLQYDDNGTSRALKVPKGDVLHQFRTDVKNGALPLVSWIVAPENFSDHPSAPWYGAWYVSEVLDILTQNPEVWKKTIFILTYDENDGYFDHVPPFVAPRPGAPATGHTSQGINTSLEYVLRGQQSGKGDDIRESPIGLGYRVPMVVASPWSRGGWVNSQVFDHTSSLQFLEKFLVHKTGQPVKENNISEWRRTVSGDLTSVFRPYHGEKIITPPPLEREAFLESIHKAQFKNIPDDFTALNAAQIASIQQSPAFHTILPKQEKGTRTACALPYALYADGNFNAAKNAFEIILQTGTSSVGAPFNVYAWNVKDQAPQIRNYAVKPGDQLTDQWQSELFEQGNYFLQVHGPNGFYRAFAGNAQNPALTVTNAYEDHIKKPLALTSSFVLQCRNNSSTPLQITVTDKSYHGGKRSTQLAAGAHSLLSWDLSSTHGWYDLELSVAGHPHYTQRYAGHLENGKASISDPLMGGLY